MIYWRDYKIPIFGTYKYKRELYTDAVMSFDTETTTVFKVGGEWCAQDFTRPSNIYRDAPKRCFVYIWQMAINDDVIYGRDIRDFFVFWERFALVNPAKNIVYVHNLGYDFEFLCEYLPRDTVVFAKSAYKPMYVHVPSMGIEYRCSYMLTNMALERCAKEFGLSVKKMSGDMAYNVMRLPNTPLTPREMAYCEFDVRVINAMIREIFLKRYDCVADIPLTQTGEVRRECKKIMQRIPYHLKNMRQIKPNLDMYKIFVKILQGGYTHLNYFYNNITLSNVVSYDKTSSYPDIMCTRLFPVGQFRQCTEYIRGDKHYAYILYIRCEKIRAKTCWSYIARHKITKSGGCKNDNGKINYCDYAEMWVTDIDYDIILDNYAVENGGGIAVLKVYKSYKNYLPREFVLMVLKQYSDKTKLKNVEGMSAVYMQQKQKINSDFGMMITNDIHDDILFNTVSHVWECAEPLTDNDISAKLSQQKPFLYFAWGIWVTAYGRNDIFRLLMQIDFDAVYSDTDSIKMLNGDKYRHLIDDFNAQCDERIARVCKTLDISTELFSPRDINGIVHTLGHFECEGTYDKFLSIGAKKYCYMQGGKFRAVVAGMQKSYIDKDGVHQTLTRMDDFKIGKSIPNARSIHWHLTEQTPVTLTDKYGNVYTVDNKQGIALMSASYTFSVTSEYDGFVLDMRNKYTDITRIYF